MKAFLRFMAVGVALVLGLLGLGLSTCGGILIGAGGGILHISGDAAAVTALGIALILAAIAIIRRLDKRRDRDS